MTVSTWTGEEVSMGLIRWLSRRVELSLRAGDLKYAAVVDTLLEEVKDAASEGWMPWQGVRGDQVTVFASYDPATGDSSTYLESVSAAVAAQWSIQASITDRRPPLTPDNPPDTIPL